MEHGSAQYLHIGDLAIPSVLVTMFGITVLLTVLSYLATRNMKERPGTLQNLMEKAVEMLRNFLSGIVGEHLAREFLPFLATVFLFVLLSNYSGLLPLAGQLPGLAAPTSSLSIIAGLAVCSFVMTHVAGVKGHGAKGYIQHFFLPVVLLFPLLVLEEFLRPLSLTLRLYGNIFGEETVTHEIFNIAPILAPVVMQILSLLLGGIQAIVFTLLTAFYLKGAYGEGHEGHQLPPDAAAPACAVPAEGSRDGQPAH